MNTDRKEELQNKARQLIFTYGNDVPEDFKEDFQIPQDIYSEGTLLKELRTYLDVQQKDIAEGIGISAPALSRHENRRKVNDETLKKYLDYLGLHIGVLNILELVLSVLDTDLNGLLNNWDESINKLEEMKAEIKKGNRQRYINDINGFMTNLPMSKIKDIHKYVYTMYLFNVVGLDLDNLMNPVTPEQMKELLQKANQAGMTVLKKEGES